MLTIKAEKRQIFGKELKAERQAGKMPVIVYGRKQVPQSLFVDAKEFKKVLSQAGESTMISVDTVAGSHDTLIHEVAFHPISGEPLHADFLLIDKTKAIKIDVPLVFEGVAPAVKDLGGTLVKVLHELEIETLPTHIPHEIKVDISALTTLESQILIKDLVVASEVKILNNLEDVVALISVAKDEPVEEAPVDLAAIKVVEKGKKPVEGEGEAAAEAPAADEAK